MELYRSGYYYAWTEREQLIFSNRVNVDIKTIREVVGDALKWGFFHQKLEQLEPLQSVNLSLIIHGESASKMKIRLTWDDDSGKISLKKQW